MPDPAQSQPSKFSLAQQRITGGQLYVYSASAAAAVACSYYIHPLIARVGETFEVSGGLLGLVPALNQIGLALGILLLMPLGDRMNNRRLVTICITGQLFALLAMGLVQNFTLFLIAAFILGFLTVTPYLLPTYVSKRVRPERLGKVTGIMSAGVAFGILASRAGGGVIGSYFGWRATYLVGGALMFVLLFALRHAMKNGESVEPEKLAPTQGYKSLLASLWPMALNTPHLISASIMQALGFGAFISLWLGIGLHLTTPEMGYDVDTAGYLAMLAIIGVFTAPYAGQYVDKVGSFVARRNFAVVLFAGTLILPFAEHNIWMLFPPIILSMLGGASLDIGNRTLLFKAAEEMRTRLMTIYIVIMFAGGGLISWLATFVWDNFGWQGIANLNIAVCAMILAIAWWSSWTREAASRVS